MIVLTFAFLAGVLTIAAPCTLPILPVVLAGGSGPGRRRIAGLAVGFAATFLALTFVLASALAAVGLTASLLRLIAALAIGLGGLALALPRLVPWVRRVRFAPAAPLRMPVEHGDGLWRGVIIGSTIGLIWAPCVGPLMGPVIAAAVVEGPTFRGVAIGASYILGALVPIAAVAALGRRVTHGAGRATGVTRRSLGIAMIVASAAVLTGTDTTITAAFTAAAPVAAPRGTADAPDGDAPVTQAPLPDLGPAPEIAGITAWINGDPTTLAANRGRVVLVHFWTFGCINCVHVQPYVKAWYDAYAADGFVVIGVHTPELSFERDLSNVRRAVADADVRFPVAFDPDFATWRAYGNQYWPAFYLIDKRGHLRRATAGEGGYEEEDAAIRALLAEPG